MADGQDSAGGIFVPPPSIYAGGLLLGSGTLLAVWFSRTMRRANVPLRLDEPAPKLVTDGPFRHSRNPGYLSFALIYAGLATLRSSSWSILLLPAVLLLIQRRAIEKEERYLERAFGDEYRRYKERTRRWI